MKEHDATTQANQLTKKKKKEISDKTRFRRARWSSKAKRRSYHLTRFLFFFFFFRNHRHRSNGQQFGFGCYREKKRERAYHNGALRSEKNFDVTRRSWFSSNRCAWGRQSLCYFRSSGFGRSSRRGARHRDRFRLPGVKKKKRAVLTGIREDRWYAVRRSRRPIAFPCS